MRWVLGALLLSLSFGKAQMKDGKQLVTAELLSSIRNPKGAFTVGIRFSIAPDWYLYWKNPGDAGLPIVVQWALPDGWSADQIAFPTPAKFAHDGIVAYGYKNEVILLATLRPKGTSKGPIEARLDWLVCRESCLRGGTSVKLDLSQMGEESLKQSSENIDAARRKLPGTIKESGVFLGEARMRKQGEEWSCTIGFSGKNAGAVSDFFPETNDDILVNFSSIGVAKNSMSFAFSRQNTKNDSATLRGLLVTKESAFECEVPLKFPSY